MSAVFTYFQNAILGKSYVASSVGSSGPPPTYTPALQFNDTGGSGGGDRNSMYLPVFF